MNSMQPIIFLSSRPVHFIFYALVIFFTSTTVSASFAGNETDYLALQKIKLMIVKDPYGALTSWNSSLHFCDWNGVTCGKRHRRVTRVVLESQGLEGLLSPHVGNLSFLHDLRLRNNSFQGAIPHELGRLSKLRFLYMSRNNFSGFIPANISGCSVLEDLRLSVNELVGSIPSEMSFLSKLTIISLRENKLTGGISHFLGNITSIEVIDVSENPLGGSIPEAIGNLKALGIFYSENCNLTGTIPHSLFNLSLLANLSLSWNQLSGSLPPAIMLPHVFGISLTNNQLSGPLPPSISNCSRLSILEITTNKFSGKLTIDFSKLRDISYIRLGSNLFENKEADEMKFIDSMKNCTRLIELDLGDCKFQGVLPRSIGNLSSQLQYLALGANQLHGNIPESIGNLVGLLLLILGPNQFTGSIPSTVGNLQELETLQLDGNELSGPIPDVIGKLSMLLLLSLSFNKLEGHIPSSLGNCSHILELFLNNNKLNGEIPTQIFQLSSLSKSLDLSQNNLFGSLPYEIGNLNMLSELYLSNNNISGNIPSSLGRCTSLTLLSLEGNIFQGSIPPSLSSLKGLVKLDISRNNLSGQIPQFFEGFSLEYLNLSYNDFEGEVPMVGVFANATTFSVLGNSRLCGGIIELELPKCKQTKKHNKKFPLYAIVILIASTLSTIACVAYSWRNKKVKRKVSPSSTSKRFIKVSFNQLLKATNGFSESNLIGNGGFSSVYKGTLDEDDRLVAIKVLHLQNRGAQRSFERECEAWRNIRHRNLLKIITSCSSVDFQGNEFKALVYEFMSNGSLHDWLHSSESTSISRLNIFQITNILTDVAYALDYLHNHCIPTVVHGDLKPSNILLDDDMVAHVGDFGLAQLLLGSSHPNSTTGFRGTIGYAPPEYGLSHEMTTSGDVYSFGILLLEAMTGKRPTDDMFIEGLNLHRFSSMALLDHVTDVNIQSVYQRWHGFNNGANAKEIDECVAATIKIGVLCSVDSPPERINVETIVHELQHILDTLQNIEV